MAKCDFCGKIITAGTGKKYIKKDGKILDFCSLKCEKNMVKLRRKPRATRWSEHYEKPEAGQKKK
ncbi:50S ribosomal protein L24e [Candidatus Woesearchaeota archaeon]|nr:50S ribosomal protein L24e [Candidatus Woesearchaeota archaeon]